jgi:CHAD domain-containing protein
MPIDQEHCRTVFRKLGREVAGITRHSSPQTVHKFRTSTRRVEAVVEELSPGPDRSAKRLVKMLRRLRKKAGKVRDLDVQIASLRNLKIARKGGQKSQLLRALAVERVKKEKKLAATLDKDAVRLLLKRMKRVCGKLDIPAGVEPITLAFQALSAVARDHSPLTQNTVHQYRIAGKRARYLLELAGKDPQAQAIIEKLKIMQDVVGDWHDWLILTERAEELFGGIKDSALVAAMRNLTRAKFRESVDAIVQMRPALSRESAGLRRPGEVLRKQPENARGITFAAA